MAADLLPHVTPGHRDQFLVYQVLLSVFPEGVVAIWPTMAQAARATRFFQHYLGAKK